MLQYASSSLRTDHLVFEMEANKPAESTTPVWHNVMPLSQLKNSRMKCIEVEDRTLVIVYLNDQRIYAMDGRCYRILNLYA